MIDHYPTRKETEGRFMDRVDPIGPKAFKSYERDGYMIFKDFFYAENIAKCLEDDHAGFSTMEPGQNILRSMTGVHHLGYIKDLSKNADMLDFVKEILGGPCYIHQSRINYKAPVSGSGWSWHSDFETWHAQDGMPRMRCVTAMIPLTPNTEVNGSLMVIPGSHKYFYSCRKEPEVSAEENFADQKEGVPPKEAILEFYERCGMGIKMITCQPGDLVLFDCNLIHVSTANLSPNPRTNLFFVYNSVENQLVEPFSASCYRPESMGTRNNITSM